MATKGTAWVLRRSTDLVPALLALAVKELVVGSRHATDGLGELELPAAAGWEQADELVA